MRIKALFFLSLLLTCTHFSYAIENTVDDIISRELQSSTKKLLDKPYPDVGDKDKVLVKELKEIVLIDNPTKIDQNPKSEMKNLFQDEDYAIYIDKFSIPKSQDLIELLRPYFGKPITINNLFIIRTLITEHYRKFGYPLVGVSVPAPQNIREGKIYVLVLIGKLGDVKVKNATWTSNKLIYKSIRTKPGEDIISNQMIEDLAWINNNPFRSVDLFYEKGITLSETNVVLDVNERFPIRAFGGYEYTGNIIAGDNRWLGGINLGNVWGRDHQINFQFMSANTMDKWWGVSGDYIAPIPSIRHIFTGFASYIKTNPAPLQDPNIPPVFSMRGKNWRVGARYSIYLPTIANLRHNILLGYDFKRTNNFLAFSLQLLFRTNIDISQFLIGYMGKHESKGGITDFGFTFYISPGGMTHYNKDSNFAQENPGAKANYVFARGTFDRITMMPLDFSWVFSTLFLWSSGKLLPSEQLTLGGFLTIRGYDENEIVSDNGFIIKNEFRTPGLQLFKKRKISHELQFLAFLDYGYAIDVNSSIYNKEYATLLSIGPGVRYTVREYVSVRFDYGFQLVDIKGRPFVSTDHSRAHVGVTLALLKEAIAMCDSHRG